MLFTGREPLLILLLTTVLMVLTVWHGYSVLSVNRSLSATTALPVSVSVNRPSDHSASPAISGLAQLPVIRKAHLFGRAEAPVRTVISSSRSALPVAVLGIIAGDEGRSVALLNIKGKQLALREGAKLPLSEEVSIVAITADRVVFGRGSKNNRSEESIVMDQPGMVPGLNVSN